MDITANHTWLLQKLKKIEKEYPIDSFYLDFGTYNNFDEMENTSKNDHFLIFPPGTAYNMPHYYQCSRSLLNPDEYKTIFGRKFENSIKIMAYSGAISPPKLPTFLSLPPVNASWEGLQSILPTALV